MSVERDSALAVLREAQRRAEDSAMRKYFERLRIADPERCAFEEGHYARKRLGEYHSELRLDGIDPASCLGSLAERFAQARREIR